MDVRVRMVVTQSTIRPGTMSLGTTKDTAVRFIRWTHFTAVSSEAWAKLRDRASVAGRGRLLLSGSAAHASLKTAVSNWEAFTFQKCHPVQPFEILWLWESHQFTR